MTSKVNLIVLATLDPAGSEAFAEYGSKVGPVLVGAGARPIGRFMVNDVMVGQNGPQMVAMMEFDSADAARSAFATDAYLKIKPLRDKAFSDLTILITEQAA